MKFGLFFNNVHDAHTKPPVHLLGLSVLPHGHIPRASLSAATGHVVKRNLHQVFSNTAGITVVWKMNPTRLPTPP